MRHSTQTFFSRLHLVGRAAVAHPIGFSFAFTAAFFVLFYVTAVPRFETNDDGAMLGVVSGLCGTDPSGYLYMTHTVLGKLLAFLYGSVSPDVNWYVVHFYLYHFLSVFLLGCVLLRRRPKFLHFFLYLALLLTLELRFLQFLQVTTTAAMAAISGGFYILTFNDKRLTAGSRLLPLALFLLVSAGLLRKEVLYLFTFLFAPLILIACIQRRKIASLIFVAIPVALVLALNVWERASLDADWHKYYNHVDVLSRIAVNPRAAYYVESPGMPYGLYVTTKAARKAYKANRWSDNDVQVFNAWFFHEPQVFSETKFETLDAHLHFFEAFNPLPRLLLWLKSFGWYSLYFFAFFLLLIPCAAKSESPYPLAAMGGVAAIMLLLAYSWRMPLWLFLPLAMFSSFAALYYCWPANQVSQKSRASWWKGSVLLAAVLVNCGFVAKSLCVYVESNRDNSAGYKRADAIFSLIGQTCRKRRALMVPVVLLPFEYVYRDSVAAHLRGADLLMNGWLTKAPLNRTLLKKYGITNAVSGLYEKPDVLVVGTEHTNRILRRFIKKHYRRRIRFEPVADFYEVTKDLPNPYRAKIFKVVVDGA